MKARAWLVRDMDIFDAFRRRPERQIIAGLPSSDNVGLSTIPSQSPRACGQDRTETLPCRTAMYTSQGPLASLLLTACETSEYRLDHNVDNAVVLYFVGREHVSANQTFLF
jgi:hypothetical protein